VNRWLAVDISRFCAPPVLTEHSLTLFRGPLPPLSSPLDLPSSLLLLQVLDLALRSGAQAIHPGYGFLSENSTFAAAAAQSDLNFIGPPPSAILAMGSKQHSKVIMEGASVPCTPGYHGSDQDANRLLHEAVNTVGFPILIKASMGGGGKGMRTVWTERDFLPALESARSEAASAFGDTDVILEKYLVDPRHIEVQIMADSHGNAVYLHERDCSLQRRHQKIIEEAPASDLSPEMRRALGEKAVMAARAVDYVNAGTVEFLLDTQSTEGAFYFCEMNTRLQVEHPVTESVTGQDLVEWQLRIAAGEVLPITDQDSIPCVGHSFEARIYAENPTNNFLPATGNVWHHRPPTRANVDENEGAGVGIRVDTAIKTGQDISVHYDPMISKLIVHGKDRAMALAKLIKSLKRYQLAGVPSNIEFLINCAEHPAFSKMGGINTGFLEHHADDVQVVPYGENSKNMDICDALASLALSLIIENKAGAPQQLAADPWSNSSGSWRVGGPEGRHRRNLIIGLDEVIDRTVVCLSNRDGSFEMRSNDGGMISLFGDLKSNGRMKVFIDETKHSEYHIVAKEDLNEGTIAIKGWIIHDSIGNAPFAWSSVFSHPLPFSSSGAKRGGDERINALTGSQIKAPMPGKITRIAAEEGEEVSANQIVIVMEAMKMEHSIEAPRSGQIVELNVAVGDIVSDGQSLAIIKDTCE